MTPHRQTTWKIVSSAELRWQVWEDQSVVYHSASGDTHLLASLAAGALRCLEEEPATVEQLLALLPQSSRDMIASLLDELNDLELIEPVVP